MADHYHAHLVWEGRPESATSYGTRLHRFLSEVGELHRRLGGWLATVDEQPVSVQTAQHAQRILEAGAFEWEVGDEVLTAYEARLYVERALASPVAVEIMCGVDRLPLGPKLFAPNRLDVRIRVDERELGTTAVLHGVLAAAAKVFEADFGHVGTEGDPSPATALYSPGVPPVGWMTFLSNRYPAMPPTFPTPSVGYPTGKGTVIVAHPNPFKPHKRAHREAIEAVADTLRAGDVLRPWKDVARVR